MTKIVEEIESLSDDELEAQILALQKAKNERKIAKRADFIRQIKELAAAIDMRVELFDLGSETLTGAEAPVKPKRIIKPKYRNPEDTSKTWTGRGVAPLWFNEMVKKGHSKDSMLIDKPASNDQPASEKGKKH